MQKVQGFGGFFFRAKDPGALSAWYKTHLGVDPVPQDYETQPWQQQTGPTVFAPFAQDTDYFGDTEKQFMLNFRITNMDGMVAQLEAAGVEVKQAPEPEPNGRFAWLKDPEGNPLELWEPN